MDEPMHKGALKPLYQRARGLLEKDGLTVMRFTNEQVEKRLEEVKQTIENYIIKYKDEN